MEVHPHTTRSEGKPPTSAWRTVYFMAMHEEWRVIVTTLSLTSDDGVCTQIVPGETALAFYTAKNLSDKAITGVATYNVTPVKAGELLRNCIV